jgi:hypothetical protein
MKTIYRISHLSGFWDCYIGKEAIVEEINRIAFHPSEDHLGDFLIILPERYFDNVYQFHFWNRDV